MSGKKEEIIAQEANTVSKIDAIKEIIFGENMQAYSSDFKAIKKDLNDVKKELESLINDVKKEMLQTIDSMDTDINIRITNVEETLNDKIDTLEETKLDRKVLGKLLVNIGNKISE